MNETKKEQLTLILSGGGVKGFAYIGVFKKLLEEKKLKANEFIKNIIGVSIGSVFGLLLIVGHTYDEMYEEFVNKNLTELTDYKISNFVKNYGFESGKIFMAWLETLLLKKGIDKNITFEELYKKTNINYSVVATNLSLYKQEIFNKDISPNMRVLKAIRMSISLPLILTKQNYKNNIYIDGGVIHNLPMKLAESDFPNVLGINLISINEGNKEYIIDSVDKYMYHVCNCFFRFKSNVDTRYKEKVIDINIEEIESFNWNITEEQKKYLIECGYRDTDKYFKNKNNFIE